MFQYQRPLLARSVIAELIMFIFIVIHDLLSEIANKVMQIFLCFCTIISILLSSTWQKKKNSNDPNDPNYYALLFSLKKKTIVL